MSKIDIEVLRAFKTLGVSDATAETAAVAFEGALGGASSRIESRFDKLDGQVAKLGNVMDQIETTLRLHSWMIGVHMMLSIATLGLMAGLFELIIDRLGG